MNHRGKKRELLKQLTVLINDFTELENEVIALNSRTPLLTMNKRLEIKG